MAGKGSGFEREICKILSRWWSDGEDDGIFWRTSQSGGRATTRAKQGRKTKNSCGDVCAIDPVGQPLLDLITVEIKRGYSSSSIQDLLDKGPRAAKQTYEKWIEKAILDSRQASSFSWMLIVKRDKRESLVLFPHELKHQLPSLEEVESVAEVDVLVGDERFFLTMVPLKTWLEIMSKEDMMDALAMIRERRR